MGLENQGRIFVVWYRYNKSDSTKDTKNLKISFLKVSKLNYEYHTIFVMETEK